MKKYNVRQNTRPDPIVFVIEQGQLVESGNHQMLVKKEEKYARLWIKQSNGGEIFSENFSSI